MTVRVLIVDDSFFVRNTLGRLLPDKDIEIVGVAKNGQEAVTLAKQLDPDCITMDIEMPVMDGVTALKKIMAHKPVPVLMFSALTQEGAQATIDALNAGAVDWLPKRFSEISANPKELGKKLQDKIRIVAKAGKKPELLSQAGALSSPRRSPQPQSVTKPHPKPRPRSGQVEIVVIGCSTGGPAALQRILTHLPNSYRLPTLVVQHMPASFTKVLAERLDTVTACRVHEAEHGGVFESGSIYIAPGGKQLEVHFEAGHYRAHVMEAEPGDIYKPCVDITLQSLANAAHDRALAVILTGMGHDGCKGAQALQAAGSRIWAQDEASSLIYGMPKAVTQAGLVEMEVSLDELPGALAQVH